MRFVSTCLSILATAMLAIAPASAAPTSNCPPPKRNAAWQSAVTDGGLLSLFPDAAGLQVRRATHDSPAGHWIHFTDGGPVNGTLAWWPCGATRARWLSTGGFDLWRPGPTLRGRASIWLQTRRFGTGAETVLAHWVVPTTAGLHVVWEGEVYERFSGPVEIRIHRQLRHRAGGVWQVFEQRSEDGRRIRVPVQALCWRPVRQTISHLVPCHRQRPGAGSR